MPAFLDISGLRSLGGKMRAWINGDLTNAFTEATITEIMPNIMAGIYANAGIPIAVGDKANRYVPIVSAGAGGITAYQEIGVEEQDADIGTRKFGVFPIVRSGSRLQMMVSKDQQQDGQMSIPEAVENALSDDSIESNVLGPLMNALERAKEGRR